MNLNIIIAPQYQTINHTHQSNIKLCAFEHLQKKNPQSMEFSWREKKIGISRLIRQKVREM